jgi:hypothetical protein
MSQTVGKSADEWRRHWRKWNRVDVVALHSPAGTCAVVVVSYLDQLISTTSRMGAAAEKSRARCTQAPVLTLFVAFLRQLSAGEHVGDPCLFSTAYSFTFYNSVPTAARRLIELPRRQVGDRCPNLDS